MDAKQLREAALSLSAEERANLAHDLLHSLDDSSDPGAGAAWLAEIEKRAVLALCLAGTIGFGVVGFWAIHELRSWMGI